METETEHFTLVLKNIVALMNQPIELRYILDAISFIISKGKLGGFFEQIVDLLVGWSIDSSTPAQLVKSTAFQSKPRMPLLDTQNDFKSIKNELMEKDQEIQKLSIQHVINELSGLFIERYSFTLNLLQNLTADLLESKDTKILVIFNIILKSVYSKYIINDLELHPVIEIAKTKDIDTMFDLFSTLLLNPAYSYIYGIITELHFKLLNSNAELYLQNVQKVLPGPEEFKDLFLNPQFIKEYRNFDIIPILKVLVSSERSLTVDLWTEFLSLKEKEVTIEIKGKKVKNKLIETYLQIFSYYKNNDSIGLFKKLYNLKLNEQSFPHLYNLCNTNNFFIKDQEAINIQFQIINSFSKPNHYSRNMLGLNWIQGIVQAQKIINDEIILKLEHSLILYLKSSGKCI
ncbi:hypothetical protein HK103_005592 [Boothiomyces macroporosus]|uniref:Uncharacterized protein n=1 Tax=Boothiomyces macroporosus TaxID=261099 RepID=A0AAD5UHZ0_9FUNG|nr:hypothetical protein HK103_005592 [Boothiomyces macroporosus]